MILNLPFSFFLQIYFRFGKIVEICLLYQFGQFNYNNYIINN
jgi:hypothetical protein